MKIRDPNMMKVREPNMVWEFVKTFAFLVGGFGLIFLITLIGSFGMVGLLGVLVG